MVLTSPASAAASPPSVPSPFPAVSGQVNTILVDGNTAYIGGSFHALGHPTGPMSVLSRATGNVVRTYRDIAGNTGNSNSQPRVTEVEPDGAGGWYAGGNFERADGVEHHTTIAPGRWQTVRVRVRHLGRLRAVVRDAATATVLARSRPLRARRQPE